MTIQNPKSQKNVLRVFAKSPSMLIGKPSFVG